MKITSSLIIGGAIFIGLSQFIHGQCPQICDTSDNTALGDSALSNLTNGLKNTAVGSGAMSNLTESSNNTAIGYQAFFNGGGDDNTAVGISALFSSTSGSQNTAIGSSALQSNVSGSYNTAIGRSSLANNTTGVSNTAVGYVALLSSTATLGNTAVGAEALLLNETGNYNTATGGDALRQNYTGDNNTANGFDALLDNNGSNNTAIGFAAMLLPQPGNSNTAIGVRALAHNITGNSNIALGDLAGFNVTTGSNNIDIGNVGRAVDFGTIRIGTNGGHRSTFIAGISGVTIANGVGVVIDTDGHLGTSTSSARFKEAIQPMDKASEAILGLKPVTFRYKHELDPEGIPQFGLVAEEVEKVNRDLVARDEQGKPYTVRYEAVNAMLLNEFLKQHRKVEQLEKQVEALTAGLQKVSAQLATASPSRGGLETTKRASRVVLNNQ